MLSDSVILVPLNIFIYIWRFISMLAKDEKGKLGLFYKWFGILSIWLIPFTYYALYIAYFMLNALTAHCSYDNCDDKTKKKRQF